MSYIQEVAIEYRLFFFLSLSLSMSLFLSNFCYIILCGYTMLHQEIPFISQMNSLVPDRFLCRSANWRPDQRCPRRNGNESLWSVVVSKLKFVKDTRCTSPRKESQVSGLGIGSFRNEAVRDSDQSVFWGSRTRYCCSKKKKLTQFTQYHVICIYFFKTHQLHIMLIHCSTVPIGRWASA